MHSPRMADVKEKVVDTILFCFLFFLSLSLSLKSQRARRAAVNEFHWEAKQTGSG